MHRKNSCNVSCGFARRVLRTDGDFVAIVDSDRYFRSMLNRRAFIDRTPTSLADTN